jgi:hypothetical protein
VYASSLLTTKGTSASFNSYRYGRRYMQELRHAGAL